MVESRMITARPGTAYVPGVFLHDSAFEFAFTAPLGSRVELALITATGQEPQMIPMERVERRGEVRSVIIDGITSEAGYYYVVDGEKRTDPYALLIRDGICGIPDTSFDWQDDRSPALPLCETVIYKLHVRGFTKKATGIKAVKGTFAALMEKISYIKELGFSAVELMPVYDFDESLKVRPYDPLDEGGVSAKAASNYWGYAERNHYFAPKASYSSSDDAASELKELVRRFHLSGIEVYFEMYFPEGTDPMTALRAVRFFRDRYHADGLHIIGAGTPYELIASDPLLADTKLFFERPGTNALMASRRNIIEYNDDFLYCARAFLKGDPGHAFDLANMVRRNPADRGVVNYITNVNGFTLNDLVTYDGKHNEANGEGNQDGPTWNLSWNCGVEGPTRRKLIQRLRIKQIKNALLYTIFTQGIPLIYAGDEMLNTQGGNNNAYAQDNATGWIDWNRSKEAAEVRELVREAIAFRRAHPILHSAKELKGSEYNSFSLPDISFHDTKAWMGPGGSESRSLAVMYCGMYTKDSENGGEDIIYVVCNAMWELHEFALPVLPKGYEWKCVLSTEDGTADDIDVVGDGRSFLARPRTVMVLAGLKKQRKS